MDLMNLEEIRDAVGSSLSDEALTRVVEREEAAIVAYAGPHYAGTGVTITEVLRRPEDGAMLYLRRPILSVTSVAERLTLTGSDVPLTEGTNFVVWSDQGSLERVYGVWGVVVTVVYVPQDDNELRRSVLIDLVRTAVERTAMRSESVAGEYSYTAPDSWDTDRATILRRLAFMEI